LNIDWNTIEGYREDMSADEKLELLNNYDPPAPAQAEPEPAPAEPKNADPAPAPAAAPVAGSRFCARCGRPNDGSAQFCLHCGAPLNG
jgi:hypothetical protein